MSGERRFYTSSINELKNKKQKNDSGTCETWDDVSWITFFFYFQFIAHECFCFSSFSTIYTTYCVLLFLYTVYIGIDIVEVKKLLKKSVGWINSGKNGIKGFPIAQSIMPGPPPPPPPSFNLGGGSADQGRGALLQSIRAGKPLKKTVTNDKSAPAIGGESPCLGFFSRFVMFFYFQEGSLPSL